MNLYQQIIDELLWVVISWSLVLIIVFLSFNQVIEPLPVYFHENPSFQRHEGFPETIHPFQYSELYGYTNQQRWIK